MIIRVYAPPWAYITKDGIGHSYVRTDFWWADIRTCPAGYGIVTRQTGGDYEAWTARTERRLRLEPGPTPPTMEQVLAMIRP